MRTHIGLVLNDASNQDRLEDEAQAQRLIEDADRIHLEREVFHYRRDGVVLDKKRTDINYSPQMQPLDAGVEPCFNVIEFWEVSMLFHHFCAIQVTDA